MKKRITAFFAMLICISIAFAGSSPKGSNNLTLAKKGSNDMPQTIRIYRWGGTAWMPKDSIKNTWKNGVLESETKNNNDRTVYFSDVTANKVTILVLSHGTSWDSVSMDIHWMDNKMNDTMHITYGYNKSNHLWNLMSKYRMVNGYNGSGLFTTSTSYLFNVDSNNWYPDTKHDMLYSGGSLNQLQVATWDKQSKSFIPNYKLTQFLWHKWNTTFDNSLPKGYEVLFSVGGGQYVEGQRFTMAYDSHDELIFNREDDFDIDHYVAVAGDSSVTTYDSTDRLIEKITYDYEPALDEYFLYAKKVFGDFYNPTALTMIQSKESYELYPNPANERVYLNLKEPSQVAIISSEGKLVKECLLQVGCSIDLNDMQTGIYFLRVNQAAYMKLSVLK